MTRVPLLALGLVATLVACDDSAPEPVVGFAQPAAVALFRGVTVKTPGVHPYVAVLNAGRSDLTLLDAWDDTPVLSPIQIRPLQVPLPFVRPTLLASGSLWDGTDGGGSADTADLLVVAAPGSSTIDLLRTWTADNGVDAAQRVNLSEVAGAEDAELQALVVVPVPDGTAGRVSGRARLVAALTGARLAIVDYERAPDGTGAIRRAGAPVVQPLSSGGVPFDAVSLAVAPDAPARLFVASPDPIGAVTGVAELDASGAPGAWTVVQAIDARAPTRLVAVASLRERTPEGRGEPHQAGTFTATEALRVYAALDPAFCGPQRRVSCGIAVLDPATGGILPDYAAGGMTYLAPIFVPGEPVAIAIAKPPAKPPPDLQAWEPEFMTMRPETGATGTSAVAVVPSTDGRTYYVDLGRWSVPLSQSILRTGSRTRVVSAGSRLPTASPRQLGLWLTRDGRTRLIAEPETLAQAVVVTAGFTTSETWTLRYQDVLPGLGGPSGQEGLRGMTGSTGTETWLALQVAEPAPAGGETLTQVVRLYDPALGVRAGDVVSIVVRGGPAPCPTNGPGEPLEAVEATVASILAPDATRPGGAVTLAPTLTDPRLASPDPAIAGQADDWPACVAALAGGSRNLQVQVRAGGMVLTGSVTGLAGRPVLHNTAPPPTEIQPPTVPPSGPGRGSTRVEYEDEDALACPVDPWPADLATAPPEFFACTGEPCRSTCERLALARKTRRLYHVSDACRPNDFFFDRECNDSWRSYAFPRQEGPLVAFSPGYLADPADGGVLPVDDPALRPVLRALEISFTTAAGISLASRSPVAGSGAAAALPMGALTYDRSVVAGREAEGYRFIVPYAGGYVYDFSPTEPLGTAKVVR